MPATATVDGRREIGIGDPYPPAGWMDVPEIGGGDPYTLAVARKTGSYKGCPGGWMWCATPEAGDPSAFTAAGKTGSYEGISARVPNACDSVPRSTYSSSPPSGRPCASRLGRAPCWRASCAR